jgi:MEMO1 family protein
MSHPTSGAGGEPRPARHAGSWYPGSRASLAAELEGLTGEAPPAGGAAPFALIGPHAGLRYSGAVAGKGYAWLKGRSFRRVWLLGPSHHVSFEGLALPPSGMSAYETPVGDLSIDHEAVEALRGAPGFAGPGNAHLPEHSLELHAIFLAGVLGETSIVPLVVGRLGDDGAVRALARAWAPHVGPDDAVVVSSDFTHFGLGFGYRPFSEHVEEGLEQLLSEAVSAIVEGGLEAFTAYLARTSDTICGREPIRLLLASLPEGARGVDVSRDTSGRMTGDYDHSVSYASIVFERPEPAGAGDEVLK